MNPEKLTVQMVEQALGMRAKLWEGKCHQVALGIVAARLVEGRAVYGLWWGGFSPKGYWKKRAGLEFTHHGWVVLKDGRVLDPTRWSFEARKPYIYIGPPSQDYDEGANRLRERMMQPCPEYLETDPRVSLKLSPLAWDYVRILLGNPPHVTQRHVFWLANLPLSHLSDYAREVYAAIVTAGWRAAIPIDNRKRVLQE